MILEVCVDSAAGLQAAIRGGADRIELCSALGLGGLSPTAGLLEQARGSPIPVYAMIRPHAGGFVYGEADVLSMIADIDAARAAGLAGVVLGASRPDLALDAAVLRRLALRARGLGLTLHRAFDLVPDPAAAVDVAVELGFERILSSGGARTAIEGAATLSRLVERAAGRIAIMPGGGIRAADVARLRTALRGIGEIHASCSVNDAAASGRLVELGFAAAGARSTDEASVAALRRALDRAG